MGEHRRRQGYLRCRRSTVGVPELSKGVGVAWRLRRGSQGAGCSREFPKLGQTDSSGVPDMLCSGGWAGVPCRSRARRFAEQLQPLPLAEAGASLLQLARRNGVLCCGAVQQLEGPHLLAHRAYDAHGLWHDPGPGRPPLVQVEALLSAG